MPPEAMAYRARAAPTAYTYTDSRFSLGKATSFAPSISGRQKLPKMPGMAGIMNRKIMTIPCMVNIRL